MEIEKFLVIIINKNIYKYQIIFHAFTFYGTWNKTAKGKKDIKLTHLFSVFFASDAILFIIGIVCTF